MKLVTYLEAGRQKIGVADPVRGTVIDLQAASGGHPGLRSMLDLIDGGESLLADVADLIAAVPDGSPAIGLLDAVRLLAPLPEPRQMRDFSVFPGHIVRAPQGMQKLGARFRGESEAAISAIAPLGAIPDAYRNRPIYYITNRFAVAGPGDPVQWPSYSIVMDFELEYGIVLGRTGRNITSEDARSHIFGYAIYNDFSARDTQFYEMQGMLGPAKGKSFDGSNVIGPWIVTPDEIPDPNQLQMTVRVNGEQWGTGNSRDMLHTFEEMIAYVSRHETLYAGEFFGSGTVGFGCGLEVDRYLRHGDVVELEVESLGILRNQVLRPD